MIPTWNAVEGSFHLIHQVHRHLHETLGQPPKSHDCPYHRTLQSLLERRTMEGRKEMKKEVGHLLSLALPVAELVDVVR
jgi:hypothetical protein